MGRNYFRAVGYWNLAFIVLLNGVRNLGTIIEAYLTKYVIEALTAENIRSAVCILLIKVIFWVLIIIVNNYYQNYKQYLQKKADVVGKTIIAGEISKFNQTLVTHDVEDKLKLVQENARAPFSFLFNASSTIINLAAVVIVVFQLINYSPVLLLFLMILVSINVFFAYKQNDIDFLAKTRSFDSEKMRKNIKSLFYETRSLKEVRIWSCAPFLMEKYERASAETFSHTHKANRTSVYMTIINEIVWAALTIIVFFYSTGLYQNGFILISDCAFIIEIWCGMDSQIDELRYYIISVIYDSKSMKICRNLFGKSPKGKAAEEPSDNSIDNINAIECRKVSFTYSDNENTILRDVSCVLEKGKCYVLLGKNGAGKTTFSRLLQGELIPTSGEILLNGIYSSGEDNYYNVLSKSHSFLGQDSTHFSMSVRDNICLDKTYIPSNLQKALEMVGLSEKINGFDNKEETILGKNYTKGEELSGGQWQKIALARMIYANSDFVILDEPTAEVDAIAEMNFYNEVKRIFYDKIVLLITHKCETISIADTVFFISNGILYTGNNVEELKLKCREFADMCAVSEELA